MREEELSYTDEIYVRKCKQTDILPLKYTFFLYDMVFFHDILCSRIPLSMPQYLSFLMVTHACDLPTLIFYQLSRIYLKVVQELEI